MFFVVGNSLQRSNKTNVLATSNIRIVEKQQGYCSVGYARVVERSEKFDSIKYQNQRSAKLICDPRLIPINQKIGSKRIEKSLYYIPADCKSAGTLALLLHTPAARRIMLCLTFYFLSRSIKATRLLFCRICYPTAKNIRICEASGLKNQLR